MWVYVVCVVWVCVWCVSVGISELMRGWAQGSPEVAQLAAAGHLPGHQLPQEHAKGEDVGDLIALAARQQLGRSVGKGAHAVQVADVRRLHHLRQAHIRNLGLALPARGTAGAQGKASHLPTSPANSICSDGRGVSRKVHQMSQKAPGMQVWQ